MKVGRVSVKTCLYFIVKYSNDMRENSALVVIRGKAKCFSFSIQEHYKFV